MATRLTAFSSLLVLLLALTVSAGTAASSPRATVEVNDQGPAYPLRIDPPIFAEQKIISPDGGQYFGQSVAVARDTLLVGAPGSGSGAVYVFFRSGAVWSFQQKLTPLDVTMQDFGHWVALSGDTAIIGSPSDDIGQNYDQGSAYVFTRTGTTWSLQQRLIAPDGGQFDCFGDTLDVLGDTAFVSAFGHNGGTGAVYVFVRNGTTWSLQQELTASDGAAGDWFGSSVAVSIDTVLIGAEHTNTPPGTDQGAAYVFTRSGTTWAQQAKLVASDGASNDGFAYSVALWGDTALVGAPSDDGFQGSAYAFTRKGTTWSQQAKLTAAAAAANDQFGISVALWGDMAIVGAFLDDVGLYTDQGSAYVFMRNGTTWNHHTVLTGSDGESGDHFGMSVAFSGDTALVGSYYENWPQGAAYVYTLPFKLYIPYYGPERDIRK